MITLTLPKPIKMKYFTSLAIILSASLLFAAAGQFVLSQSATFHQVNSNNNAPINSNSSGFKLSINDPIIDLGRLTPRLGPESSSSIKPTGTPIRQKGQIQRPMAEDQLALANLESIVLSNNDMDAQIIGHEVNKPVLGLNLLSGKRRLDGDIVDTTSLGRSIMLAASGIDENLIAAASRGRQSSKGLGYNLSGGSMHNKIVDNGLPPLNVGSMYPSVGHGHDRATISGRNYNEGRGMRGNLKQLAPESRMESPRHSSLMLNRINNYNNDYGVIHKQESRKQQQKGRAASFQGHGGAKRRSSPIGRDLNIVDSEEEDGEQASDRRSDAFDNDNDNDNGINNEKKTNRINSNRDSSNEFQASSANDDDNDADEDEHDDDAVRGQQRVNGNSKLTSRSLALKLAASKREDQDSSSGSWRRGPRGSPRLVGGQSPVSGRGDSEGEEEADDEADESVESSDNFKKLSIPSGSNDNDELESTGPGSSMGGIQSVMAQRRTDELEVMPFKVYEGADEMAEGSRNSAVDLQTAAGHHHGHNHHYYQYVEVPKKKTWKFGFKRGNHKHEIERHEKGHKSKFHSSFKWHAKEKCKKKKKCKSVGKMTWDYKHHDKKKHH